MFYPENLEAKIGFKEIRTWLKGHCQSTLGTEWVDKELKPMTRPNDIRRALDEAREFCLYVEESDDDFDSEFFDVREALLRIRPERTYLEEIDLFNLKRSISTVSDYAKAFTRSSEDDEGGEENTDGEEKQFLYPALGRMAAPISVFPELVKRIGGILNQYGRIKDTASPELLSIRHQIEVTTRGISHSLRSIVSEAQSAGYIDRDVAPTLRDGRLMIPVAPALKRKIKGIIHDESATGKTVFIEPEAVVDANNKIRSLHAAEKREVIRILQEITNEIRPHVSELLTSLQFLSHTDLPPAFGPEMSKMRCPILSVMLSGTIVPPCWMSDC